DGGAGNEQTIPGSLRIAELHSVLLQVGTGLVSWRVRGPREPFSGGPSAGSRFADPGPEASSVGYVDVLHNRGCIRPPAYSRACEIGATNDPGFPDAGARLQMIRAGKQLQCVIPQVQQIHVPGGNLTVRSYVIGVSEDAG